MLNKRILAVIKRELREKLMSKAFIFMTILMPALMFLMIGMQALIMTYEGGKTTLKVVTDTPEMTASFKSELESAEFVKDGKFAIEYLTMDQQGLDTYLKTAKKDILNEKITAILFINANSVKDKKVTVYSKTPNMSITEKLNRPINKVLVSSFFAGRLSNAELSFAGRGVDFNGFKITENEDIKEESYGNLILSYIFTFMLYLSLIIMGQMTMASVIEEKNNRIVEIILSSVSPKELLAGKIYGSVITAFFQMVIWLSPIIILSSTTLFALPKEYMPDITMFHLIFLLIYFVMGLFIYTGLFAMVGSIFDNAQDAQQGIWPLMLLIIIPFFISFSMIRNPSSPLAEISSMLPFASIIVMPARYAITPVPGWQMIISIIVNILTIMAISPIAGKIYRIGILRTGTKPKWSEVIKWLRYKY
jgi:ABC-2 type transport system permease protein